MSELSKKYSETIGTPIYLPKNNKPNINGLFNEEKYQKFLMDIDASELPDAEKYFLKLSSTRHIVFNYDLIADYYAHSGTEMKRLMEKLALVIIDLDNAIENGYTRLAQSIIDQYSQEYEA